MKGKAQKTSTNTKKDFEKYRRKHYEDSDDEESDEDIIEREPELKVKILIGTEYKNVPEKYSFQAKLPQA
jgi:hypothetical protein